jgi:hypothetical protein
MLVLFRIPKAQHTARAKRARFHSSEASGEPAAGRRTRAEDEPFF